MSIATELPVRARRTRTARRDATALPATVGLALGLPLVALTALLLAYPIVLLVQEALAQGGLHNVSAFVQDPLNRKVLMVTFRDSGIASVVTIAIGGLLAWQLRTTSSRIVRLAILSAIFVPLWMGSVIKIYALSLILQRGGIASWVLQRLGIVNHPVSLLYSQFAVMFGLVYQLLPFAALPLYVAFQGIDLGLPRAAESLGASRSRAMLDVVLPLMLPGLLASLALVFIISIGFYLTPELLGGGTAPFTASLIDTDLNQVFDTTDAALSSLALLIGGMIVLLLGYLLVGKERLVRAVA